MIFQEGKSMAKKAIKQKPLVFENYYLGKSGIWFFMPDNYQKFKEKKRTHGFGMVRYDEGSIYVGELIFDGKNYNKIGTGRQDFANSFLGNVNLPNQRILCYMGHFDYRKTDWIYGNGVLYFIDQTGKPTHFVKGFYEGLTKVGPYIGKFDYSRLLEGYTQDMEMDYSPRDDLFYQELKAYIPNTSLEDLFIGDSYFEFWHYHQFTDQLFEETYPKETHLNLGLGGTKFSDWIQYVSKIQLDKAPKRVFIHLGVNDTHSCISNQEILSNYKKVVELLKEKYPLAKLYVFTATESPAFEVKKVKVARWNALLKREAPKDDVIVLDINARLKKKYKENNTNFFYEDGLHLNTEGYKEIVEMLKEEVA